MPQAPAEIPVASLSRALDNDDPAYLIGQPGVYLTLALCYDSLAAPAAVTGPDGVISPDFGHMVPRLATGWTRSGAGDWAVDLRPGVLSQAGHELEAGSIAWAFRKAFANPAMAAWRWRDTVGLEDASSVRVLGRYRVGYTLRGGNPHFPAYLQFVTPNVVDHQEVLKHADAADPWGIGWLNRNVAGYGAYDLAAFSQAEAIFTARSSYWAGPGEVVEVRLSPVATRTEALKMLDGARPVILLGLDSDETLAVLSRGDVDVRRTWAGHARVQLDVGSAPFDDLRVRQALALAVPYDEIIEVGFRGLARPWRSPVKRISPWYTDRHWRYATDSSRARELLAAAGLRDGFETQLYVPCRPDCDRVSAILRRAWAAFGIEVDLVPEPAGLAASGQRVPMLLSVDCGHNLSEPLYDLVHDFAPFMPLFPDKNPGSGGVGNWHLYFVRQEEIVDELRAALEERDEAQLHARVDALQRSILDTAATIHLAEVQQTLAAKNVPGSFYAPDTRFFHALQYQNARSDCYLPAWSQT
jgi:ABC-type transport system substrate-binding protein